MYYLLAKRAIKLVPWTCLTWASLRTVTRDKTQYRPVVCFLYYCRCASLQHFLRQFCRLIRSPPTLINCSASFTACNSAKHRILLCIKRLFYEGEIWKLVHFRYKLSVRKIWLILLNFCIQVKDCMYECEHMHFCEKSKLKYNNTIIKFLIDMNK